MSDRRQPFRADAAVSRRDFLREAGALAGLAVVPALTGCAAAGPAGEPAALPEDLRAVPDRSASAPATPVAIARCRSYEAAEAEKALRGALDLLGGIEKLVSGKTVTVKLNLTGDGRAPMAGFPSERTYQTHPVVVEAVCALLGRAGAHRIVVVESFYDNLTMEEMLARQGWKVDRIVRTAPKVAFLDTHNKGGFPDYATLKVPYGGYVYPAYCLNRQYADTDVIVSVSKLKEHVTAGVTGSVKNMFGIAPTALYGNDAPNERATQSRQGTLHTGDRDVPAGVPKELYRDTPRRDPYRVPRSTADLFSLRPPDLAIVDGVETVVGGEGPWCPPPHKAVAPGVIMVGRNGVTTDSVCASVMGYDPLAKYGEFPFPGENHLALLARAGLGTNDPGKIEVRGLSLREALFEFRPEKAPGWVRRKVIGS